MHYLPSFANFCQFLPLKKRAPPRHIYPPPHLAPISELVILAWQIDVCASIRDWCAEGWIERSECHCIPWNQSRCSHLLSYTVDAVVAEMYREFENGRRAAANQIEASRKQSERNPNRNNEWRKIRETSYPTCRSLPLNISTSRWPKLPISCWRSDSVARCSWQDHRSSKDTTKSSTISDNTAKGKSSTINSTQGSSGEGGTYSTFSSTSMDAGWTTTTTTTTGTTRLDTTCTVESTWQLEMGSHPQHLGLEALLRHENHRSLLTFLLSRRWWNLGMDDPRMEWFHNAMGISEPLKNSIWQNAL